MVRLTAWWAIKKLSPHFPWPQQNSKQRQNSKILSARLEFRCLWWREIRELARFARDSEANPQKIYRIETDWRMRQADANSSPAAVYAVRQFTESE
jgi:hypothetical protein